MMEIGEISGFIFPLFRHYKVSFGTDDMLLSEKLIPVK